MKYIIGFSGNIGVGKDYISQRLFMPLFTKAPTIFISLADEFKIRTIVEDGISRDRVYGQKDDESRRALQKRGTEEGRMKFGDDIWIRYIDQIIKNHEERGIVFFVITDVRFPNEVKYVLDNGGEIVRVVAPQRNMTKLLSETRHLSGNEQQAAIARIKSHASERSLDDYKFRFILKNDPDDNVLSQITDMISEFSVAVRKDQLYVGRGLRSEWNKVDIVMIMDREKEKDLIVKKFTKGCLAPITDNILDYPATMYIWC